MISDFFSEVSRISVISWNRFYWWRKLNNKKKTIGLSLVTCHLPLVTHKFITYVVSSTPHQVNRLNRAKRYFSVSKRNDLSHDLLDDVYNCTALWHQWRPTCILEYFLIIHPGTCTFSSKLFIAARPLRHTSFSSEWPIIIWSTTTSDIRGN